MAVFNGQRADQVTFNNAFLSRTQDSDTVAIVGLNHPSSGGLIANAQLQINTNKDNIASNDTDILNLQLEKEDKINKGAPLGYVPLNAATKIDNIYLDDRVVTIEGNWDAATNTPTLIDGVGNTGEVYVVNVVGTQDLGSGPQTFELGDWAVYRASGVWQRVQNSTAVASVNGQTGAVVLNLDDINDVDIPSPGAGDDQKAVIWDNASSTFKLGSPVGTGGSGGINYVINTGAELNADDHTAYKDAALSSPEDGIGGSPTLTVTRSTISGDILNGDGTFVISKPASNVQGEGIHVGLDPIDPRYKNERLQVSFEMKNPNPGSNLYADDDFRVFVYDVDNATLIGALENDDNGFIKRHAGDGVTILGFFNATNSLNYRLLIHCVTTSTDASVIAYDNVKLGPIEFISVNGDTDWEAYTPSFQGFGTVTSIDCHWRKRGQNYELSIEFQSGTNTATEARIGLPNGKVLSNFVYQSPTVKSVGEVSTSYAAPIVMSVLAEGGQSYVKLGRDDAASSGLAAINGNTIADNSQISFTVSVAIEGLSETNTVSNTVLTQTTSNVAGAGNAGTSLTALVTNIDFTEVSDSHGQWSGSVFTAKRSTVHTVSGSIWFTAPGVRDCYAYVNGVQHRLVGYTFGVSAQAVPFNWEGFLNKGDTLSIRSAVAGTLSNSVGLHWINISSKPNYTTYGLLNPNVEKVGAESATKTPSASAIWLQMTGNSIPLSIGSWLVRGMISFSRTSSPSYTAAIGKWAAANGTDTGTEPANLTNIFGLQANCRVQTNFSAAIPDFDMVMTSFRIEVSSPMTLYLVPYAVVSTPANARIFTNLSAEKIG